MNITVLDYGAGNVRSIRNAIKKLGCNVQEIKTPEDILTAERLVFPGVGSFGKVMENLTLKGYAEPLRRRIKEDKPFLGICVALQSLYKGSEETPEAQGLGIIDGTIRRFPNHIDREGKKSSLSVPQIGWNGIIPAKEHPLFTHYNGEKLYFVHSYYAPLAETPQEWLLSTTDYGISFASSLAKGNVCAVQFHPEKSGKTGLAILENALLQLGRREEISLTGSPDKSSVKTKKTKIAKRIIACLDVRSNDDGDLVVTKGDQYDVREREGQSPGRVRNLGKPTALAKRYYEEGADEITLLNITGFRNFPLQDQPMIALLKEISHQVFVPVTIGGGIREFTDENGRRYTALDVAAAYFQAGADKISIGSDAVYAVEAYRCNNCKADGTSSIEQIAKVYGAQAVVISVDPRRIYVSSPEGYTHTVIKTKERGANGEEYCWYQCTVRGGREGRDLDVVQLVTGCEALGAGEILLNCIDRDGTNSGFDLELANLVTNAVNIPVILSSGAGTAEHFVQAFTETDVDAALAAGIFHRREVGIGEIKEAAAKVKKAAENGEERIEVRK